MAGGCVLPPISLEGVNMELHRNFLFYFKIIIIVLVFRISIP